MGRSQRALDRPSDPTTAEVLDLIQLFGLTQVVESPTQSQGHTPDPLIHRKDD